MKKNKHSHKFFLILVFSILVIFAYIFRSLLLNLDTHLLDSFDYPYYVWTIYQNIGHFDSLSFNNFFNTNIFYPNQGTLLFSDLLLPQSAIGWIFHLFSDNPIFVFNLTLLSTLILNTISIVYFWDKIIKEKHLLVFASITTSLSPFLFLQLGHFQMITFWPMFIALGLLFSSKKTLKKSILIGLFFTIQFLASVYLSIFLLSFYALHELAFYLKNFKNKNEVIERLNDEIIIIAIFAFSIAPILYKYLEIKRSYEIVRSYGEYVFYAAHPSDYLFSGVYSSFISQINIIKKWNSFNGHTMGELVASPGFVLIFLGLMGLFNINIHKQKISLSIRTSFKKIVFSLTILVGLFFSFGPRLSFNGSFSNIPLPYTFLLKFIPILDPIRATNRWSFLFYFGLIFFATVGLNKILKKTKFKFIVTTIFIVLYILEIVPINKSAEEIHFYSKAYEAIETKCSNNQSVLLEYPITQDTKGVSVTTNLAYRTTAMLASLQHECLIINGYAGFDPSNYLKYESELASSILENNQKVFNKLLVSKNIDLIKLNKDSIYDEKSSTIEAWLKSDSKNKILYDRNDTLVIELNN